MSINERIRSAVLQVIPICDPGEYTGDAEEYCVFDILESPELFAEGTAHAVSAQVVLHWYRPKESNPLAKKEQLIYALVQAGATYPTITSNVEEIILEFEMEEAAAGGSI